MREMRSVIIMIVNKHILMRQGILLIKMHIVLIWEIINQGNYYMFPLFICIMPLSCYNGDNIRQIIVCDKEKSEFGMSVILNDDCLLVGAPKLNAVYEYKMDKMNKWVLNEIITPNINDNLYNFGHSISISSSTLVVGAPGNRDDEPGYGTVVVYEKVHGKWNQNAKLTAQGNPNMNDYGYSVCIRGKILAIGAPREQRTYKDVGAVYIYKETNGVWRQEKILDPPKHESGLLFGFSMAMNENYIVVGSGSLAPGSSGAYIFNRIDNWKIDTVVSRHDKRSAPVISASINENDDVVFGSPTCGLEPVAGIVYIYSRDKAGWVERAVLTPDEGPDLLTYGSSVTIGKTTLIVGTNRDVRLYKNTTGKWINVCVYPISDQYAYISSVSMNSGSVAIGIPDIDDMDTHGKVITISDFTDVRLKAE